MNIRKAFIASVGMTVALLASVPAAAQVVAEGNYIRVGFGTRGTLGVGGATSPGLIHDPLGTRNFDPNTDYITPGSPHEGFSFNSTQTGFLQNDNNGPQQIATISAIANLTGAAALGFDHAVSWTGGNSSFSMTHSYFFNDGDERITIVTTISALANLTNVAFARSVDPDSAGGGDPTANQRGTSALGLNEFVGSQSLGNGRTLALANLNGDALRHATQINSSCCSNINPYDVLAGPTTNGGLGNASSGDHGLNLAYGLGDLAAGSSITFRYAYVVGNSLENAGGNVGGVPEPSTWAMMIAGFGMIGGAMRRRATKVALAA